MDKVRELIRNKPRIYLYASIVYLLIVILLKWVRHPSPDAVWFLIGGGIGMFFLEAAEIFFALRPSPFRSIVFGVLFSVVSFFVVTSSESPVGIGLVLSLYFQMILWQVGEWRIRGNLDSWYRMVTDVVSPATQRTVSIVFACVFLTETILFIR